MSYHTSCRVRPSNFSTVGTLSVSHPAFGLLKLLEALPESSLPGESVQGNMDIRSHVLSKQFLQNTMRKNDFLLIQFIKRSMKTDFKPDKCIFFTTISLIVLCLIAHSLSNTTRRQPMRLTRDWISNPSQLSLQQRFSQDGVCLCPSFS